MTKPPLIIWCNNHFSATTQKELAMFHGGGHRLLLFDPKNNGADEESRQALSEADIAFGSPDPDALMGAARLRWVHLNSAGYTPYDRDDFRRHVQQRGIILTNSSAVYDEPCAQHLLAMMMSLARQLPAALDVQRASRAWPMVSIRANSRLLNEQTALILGFGSIARRLVELLTPLRMNLIAVRRELRGDEPIRVVTQSEADEFLPFADHLVNILPDNESTKQFVNAERLKHTKRGAHFYNVGRGSTVDQDALLESLRSGHLAAAYLDVTDPEPLPLDHPLWRTPNCYITPHTAGGHANEKERQVRHFLDNFRRFTSGESLINRIM
ncbi:MAG: D-2-hydroxyacid dehydrogenase [Acidobacteriota bacterium]|nr:D-2-hydroxyacid dehydrogenase [Acidobacteriota bacterium]